MDDAARAWVLHVDLDQFIAAVEVLRRPELAGRPVIVGGRGDPTERAVVSTASYEARRFGVDSGMPLRLAARKVPDAIILPVDAVVAREFKAGAAATTVDVKACPPDQMILDVGAKSVAHLTKILEGCHTLLWNGPLGAFEIEPFGAGTFALAKAAAALTKAGKLVSVAGGGDTVAALNAAGATGDFTYVSTAGGAFLEWLEGRELPGVAALTKG